MGRRRAVGQGSYPDAPYATDGEMTGFAGVMALVLAETVAGVAAFTWFTPLWHETKRLYFKILGPLLCVLALLAWWSASSGRIPGDRSGEWATWLALGTLAAVTLSTLVLFAGRDSVGRGLGLVSAAIAIGTLVAMAGTGRQSFPILVFQLLAGAALLGSVFVGLFLGHWYLTDRRLTRTPIQRATLAAIVATCVEAVSVITGGFSGTASSEAFNPLLTAGALAPWIALGMVGTTLLIVVLVKLSLRGERASAVQSATGFYYLAVVTAFTAEIALKTRFFPQV
jgi:hypothetical protein